MARQKINIYGPKGSGKTHLINILSKKVKLLIIEANHFDQKVIKL